MKQRRFLALFILFATLAVCIPANASSLDSATPTSLAAEWVRMFEQLNASNSITVAVATGEQLQKVNNVLTIKADGRFLILRYKGAEGREYMAIIQAEDVALISESGI